MFSSKKDQPQGTKEAGGRECVPERVRTHEGSAPARGSASVKVKRCEAVRKLPENKSSLELALK